ncbi:hypothetical protein A6E15_15185 [Natrinema saccharevitans]|uniref:Uncharacterized protein n=1 Tax=Natrinema saccharevitans TaxID=301967 RepID=A0A1S8AZF9_9EURY|nr:hypothetical protein A6E15_15185 [Natrinema saccharevitans]
MKNLKPHLTRTYSGTFSVHLLKTKKNVKPLDKQQDFCSLTKLRSTEYYHHLNNSRKLIQIS